MQKTRKISWQAIAIVVLALVLIASIALGVSGAWFQDSDSADTNVTMGEAVTIKLVDTATSADPVTWETTYNLTEAFPGDLVFGATSILPGSDSPAIYRIKIATTLLDAEGNEPAEDNADAVLLRNMLATTTLTGWTKGATDWYYYDSVNAATTAISLFEELRIPVEVTNEAAEWSMSVTVNVEAIQAANIKENADWYGDMSSTLKTAVDTYNTGRLA